MLHNMSTSENYILTRDTEATIIPAGEVQTLPAGTEATISQALGGTVEKSPRGWGIGVHTYDTDRAAPWMRPVLPRFTVPVCHQDQVVGLPGGADRLASSDHC